MTPNLHSALINYSLMDTFSFKNPKNIKKVNRAPVMKPKCFIPQVTDLVGARGARYRSKPL